MLWRRGGFQLVSDRLILRLPQHTDFREWSELRRVNRAFLTPWDPEWAPDHLTRKSFTNRVYWANRAARQETAFPLFIYTRAEGALIGALTLDNIRKGPAQMGTLGYWLGQGFTGQGFMSEAVNAVTDYAFDDLGLSRIEAACLPENQASRGVMARTGFKYEGVAQSYLQIAGRWRTHVLFAKIRTDRDALPIG